MKRSLIAFMTVILIALLLGCGGGTTTTTASPTTCQNTATTKCTQSGALSGMAANGLYVFRGIRGAANRQSSMESSSTSGKLEWRARRLQFRQRVPSIQLLRRTRWERRLPHA